MATIINKFAGTILEKYGKSVNRVSSSTSTGPVQKAWRARILTNRAMSGLPKSGSLTPNFSKTIDSITSGDIVNNFVSDLVGIKSGPRADKVKSQRESDISESKTGNPRYRSNYTNKGVPNHREINISESSMSPVVSWLDSKDDWLSRYSDSIAKGNKVIIFNINQSPYQYIELQNRPTSLDFRGETTWAVIKSMGRNLPMYHYTSAEDVIQMNISWYCNDPDNPAEVINKCRLLEAWSKANGYQSAPPVLKISWGAGNDLFYSHHYILTSATYTLSNFTAGSRSRNRNKPDLNTNTTQKYLYPYSATQELVFKRVSDHNLTHSEIYITGPGKNGRFPVSKTKGINF